jgi:hypothetical protein
MEKQTVHIKSNGIRNELKEIRKSIDALTKAIIASNKQTYEKDHYYRKHRSNGELRKPEHNDG